MSVLQGAIRGQYEVIGNPAEADCVIGLSFGTDVSSRGVNAELADLSITYGDNEKPVLMERMLVNALQASLPEAVYVIEGQITNATGSEGIGSWGVLRAAKEYMDEEGLRRPLLVAQAFHVGRVVLQAEKQDMDPVVPEHLPRQFDRTSDQIWTRRRALWIPRELAGFAYLKHLGQL